MGGINEKNKDLLYDTNEKPIPGKWLILSMQHIFAMLVNGLGTSVATTALPITGMSLAALVGIILNIVLPNKENNIKTKEV